MFHLMRVDREQVAGFKDDRGRGGKHRTVIQH